MSNAPVAYTFNAVVGGALTGYTRPLGVQLSANATTVTFASDIAALPLSANAAQEAGGNLAAIATSVAAGATAANQATANTTLSSILTKLGSAVLGAGSAIIGKFGIDQTTPGTTNGVVVNASALPAGAATATNQVAAQSAPGTPQTTALTVQGNANGIPQPVALSATSGGGWTPGCYAAMSTTQQIKSGAGNLSMIDGFNPGASAIFLQIFDALAVNVTLGTTPPIHVVVCPPGLNGGFVLSGGLQFSAGITVAATTTANGSTLVSGGNAPTVSYAFK
jgi:hypothetical protein